MHIRLETPADFLEIREINRLAFDGEAEASLIDALREAGAVTLSMVACHDDGMLMGHVLYSDLSVVADDGGSVRAVALAPLAVRPHGQGQGIGSQLVRESLAVLKDLGIDVVVVLGDPAFYSRFGFNAALTKAHFDALFEGDAFMALELREGALVEKYKVTYAHAFNM